MRLKDEFMDEIEEQFTNVIAPQQEKADIPSYDGSEKETDEMPF